MPARSAAHLSDDQLLAECDVDALRSSGPGGQRANKVETGVRLRHRPSGLTVTARRHRSRHRNHRTALDELRRRLDEAARPEKRRIPTRISKGAQRRRKEANRRHKEKKASRRWRHD
jgi:protein subunit release factor B